VNEFHISLYTKRRMECRAKEDQVRDGETESWRTSENEDLNSQKQHLSPWTELDGGSLLGPIVAMMRTDGTEDADDELPVR
jgi:hypothetical protein